MYKSPIEIFMKQIQTKQDDAVLQAVQDIGIEVHKDELIKALQYDRGQYDKGYADGQKDAKEAQTIDLESLHPLQFDSAGQWIPTKLLIKPKEWERVITYDKDRDSVYIHVWRAGYFVSIHTGERYTQERITHWMRLPKPPREEV